MIKNLVKHLDVALIGIIGKGRMDKFINWGCLWCGLVLKLSKIEEKGETESYIEKKGENKILFASL